MTAIDTFTFKRVTGSDIAPHVEDLARLRIEVFREFPYLYDGDATTSATTCRPMSTRRAASRCWSTTDPN